MVFNNNVIIKLFSTTILYFHQTECKNLNLSSIIHIVPLSDPTWFAPVINYVKSIAEHMKNDPNNYLVLLIITDGGIEGM